MCSSDLAMPDRPAPLAEGADALDEALAATRAELLQLAQDTIVRRLRGGGNAMRTLTYILPT